MNANKYQSLALGALIVTLGVLALHYYAAYSSLSNVVVTPENSSSNILQVASSTGDPYLTVSANGRVGVNMLVPQVELDVRGMARIYTSSSTPCTQSIEGALAYDPLRKHFFGCNATVWVRLDN